MGIICPKCNTQIDENDFNISTDLAYCRNCHTEHRYSVLAAMDDVDENAYERFVERYANDHGFERRVSIPFPRGTLLFLVPFTCLWSGISMVGIYISPLIQGKLELDQALFGIPFLLGTIVLLNVIFAIGFGKTRVEIERRMLRYRGGAGPFTRRKKIALDASTIVSLTLSDVKINDRSVNHIEICTGGETITFGATMKKDRKTFLAVWIMRNLPDADCH